MLRASSAVVYKVLRATGIGASIASVLILSACTGSSYEDRAAMAESALDALQEAFGEDELTPDAIMDLRNMIAALMGRADITPADLQSLREQVAMLEGRADITPADLQSLRDQVADLMGRVDITPADLQSLREQVAMLEGRADITPADLQSLRDQVADLMGRVDITPADLQSLREQVAMLEGRADITPADLQSLRDQVADLMGRVDITPADLQSLREQVAMLEGRADITPADLQSLRDQVADLMGRVDITPADLQSLREQVAMLEGRADITPADLQSLRDQVADLMGRVDITPADLQSLREQVAMLEGRADITPADLQSLRDQVADLMGRVDITPADLQSLREQVAMLEGRADITPADLQALREQVAMLEDGTELPWIPMSVSIPTHDSGLLTDDATRVTAIELDHAGGLYVTYLIDGVGQRVHLTAADEIRGGYRKTSDGTYYSIGPDHVVHGVGAHARFWLAYSEHRGTLWRGHIVYGNSTAVLPAGAAHYDGTMFAERWGSGHRGAYRGGLLLTTNFDNRSIHGIVHSMQLRDTGAYEDTNAEILIQNGTIASSGNRFDAELIGRNDLDGLEGRTTGQFFGPDASEVGGVISATEMDDTGTPLRLNGYFLGLRQQ